MISIRSFQLFSCIKLFDMYMNLRWKQKRNNTNDIADDFWIILYSVEYILFVAIAKFIQLLFSHEVYSSWAENGTAPIETYFGFATCWRWTHKDS